MDRDELALAYFEQLPYPPYPVQEQALYAWFDSKSGVLVCAPTGTGKTLIAEGAVFEALHTGRTIYYTTPLIALTDQKFHEISAAAERWGFSKHDVGLVTGNRSINPQARVLVVVAEILLNRLLHGGADFSQVGAVVMDEFHSFTDTERGIVWEFSLALLPPHVRVLLLSATVGNAMEFLTWLRVCHGRDLELVSSSERKVPLRYQWVPDKLLNELLEEMAQAPGELRRTPALVFCFNRDECWSVAEELKGKSMLAEGQQKQLADKLARYDLTKGAGPKLRPILQRGVGVHHAGLLPRYRRIVEELFQQKLLSVCVCTETLSAGINLPARSVVLPSLLKGPPGKQKVIDSSSAHQIFGRAGRPQFDTEGYVFALPHEDDVKIFRWKEKYDQIPEDTRDPGLLAAKKALKKKMPTRSPNRQYWNEAQFDKLRAAPPKNLESQGPLPWRLLAYMLQISPDVDLLRRLVRKRLMDPKRHDLAERELVHMLLTLHAAGVVALEPEPPPPASENAEAAPAEDRPAQPKMSEFARMMLEAWQARQVELGHADARTGAAAGSTRDDHPARSAYRPERAVPTERMRDFFLFRSVNPVYALFLLELFPLADPGERLQAFESVLELPRSLLRHVRVPPPHRMPPGPLAREKVDQEIVQRGLIAAGDLYPKWDPDIPFEERKFAPPLAEKLKMLFDSEFPAVHSLSIHPVWAAGELLEYEGNFHKYISGRDLAKQEGLIFRHLLKLILLLGEFRQTVPPGIDAEAWRDELRILSERLEQTCRDVDPTSTEQVLAHAADFDIAALDAAASGKSLPTSSGAAAAAPSAPLDEAPLATDEAAEAFGAGILADD